MREQMLSLILAVRERSYYCKLSECMSCTEFVTSVMPSVWHPKHNYGQAKLSDVI